MIDPRVVKMGETLINYSLSIKPGDKLVIYGTPAGAPLVYEAYRAALRAGAFPVVRIALPGLDEIFFNEASDEQLDFLPQMAVDEIEILRCATGYSGRREHQEPE